MTRSDHSPEPKGALRRLAEAAGSLAVLNLGSMAIAFLIGVLLARQLGPSDYGIYGLAMTVVTLAGMVTEFGLPTLTMREVAAAKARDNWGAARGLELWADRVVLALSALLLIGFFVWAGLTGKAATSAFAATMVWAILLIPVVALGKLRGLALLSLGHTIAGQLPVLLIRPGLFALALLAAWAIGKSLSPQLAMAMQAGAALAAMLVVRTAWLRLRPEAMRRAAPIYHARSWMAACIPMGMNEGLRLLQGQSAILLLGLLANTRQVGIYRVADAVAAIAGVGMSILATAATPMFASLHASGSRQELQRVASVTALGMTLSTFLLGLPFLLAGKWIFSFVFGTAFAPSAVPFLLIWGGMVTFSIFGPAQTLANMSGHQSISATSLVIAVSVNVGVGLVLIPFFQAAGAAMGVAAANLASGLWLWRRLGKLEGINASVFSADLLTLAQSHRIGNFLRLQSGAVRGKDQ